ncbi:hypothetical protein LG293_17620 (plasmid) [Citricoccus nitrophenolicus]
MAVPTTPLIIGATYTQVSTGLPFELAGLRSKQRVCMIHDQDGPNREVIDYLPVADLREQFRYVSCDHEDACCDFHGTHTSPHMGCLFR